MAPLLTSNDKRDVRDLLRLAGEYLDQMAVDAFLKHRGESLVTKLQQSAKRAELLRRYFQ